jgi:hypothetical protein
MPQHVKIMNRISTGENEYDERDTNLASKEVLRVAITSEKTTTVLKGSRRDTVSDYRYQASEDMSKEED